MWTAWKPILDTPDKVRNTKNTGYEGDKVRPTAFTRDTARDTRIVFFRPYASDKYLKRGRYCCHQGRRDLPSEGTYPLRGPTR